MVKFRGMQTMNYWWYMKNLYIFWKPDTLGIFSMQFITKTLTFLKEYLDNFGNSGPLCGRPSKRGRTNFVSHCLETRTVKILDHLLHIVEKGRILTKPLIFYTVIVPRLIAKQIVLLILQTTTATVQCFTKRSVTIVRTVIQLLNNRLCTTRSCAIFSHSSPC